MDCGVVSGVVDEMYRAADMLLAQPAPMVFAGNPVDKDLTMTQGFAVTFDYLCPFARNAAEAVVGGLREGRDWEVSHVPFSLSQVHIEEDDPDVWDRELMAPGTSGVQALCWALVVRDLHPEAFFDYHLASFAARHDKAANINDPAVLAGVAESAGLDPDEIVSEVATGRPLDVLANEHTQAVEKWSVFGVPTFIDGDEAVFVRLMERGKVDDVQRVLDMLAWTRLNEFKRTVVPR